MIPTPKLRFVERVIAVPATDGEGRKVRVLQQLWEYTFHDKVEPDKFAFGEWRDVPTERE